MQQERSTCDVYSIASHNHRSSKPEASPETQEAEDERVPTTPLQAGLPGLYIENGMYVDSMYEIWELNSNYLAFPIANISPKPPFCLLLPESVTVKTQ